MRDKKTIVFPTLLFAIFFILITITGIIQIKIVQNNLNDLLKNQGEILFNHVKREIDINLEYLNLHDKSPSVITPSFLNILAYDEAIAESIYAILKETTVGSLDNTPLEDVLILDEKGNTIAQKGNPRIPGPTIQSLVSKKQETLIKMPTSQVQAFLMGVREHGSIIFVSIDENELESLRKKYIIKDIIENEGKRFDVSGITLYDPQGELYAWTGEKKEHTFVLARSLDSKFLPKFTMEVFLSRVGADEIFKQTMGNFVLILVFLILSGAVSTYATFLLEKKYDKKVKEMERDMEMKDRLVSLGKLASGMAHEIRNPLNAISISVQRLKREFAPGDEKKDEYGKFIDIMRGELGRVDRIVEEFLLSTKSRVPFSSENIHNVVEDVVTILHEKAAMKDVTLINNIEKDIRVECQTERIKQAFYNIFLNSIEAIADKGMVEILSVRMGPHVNISVKDNGSGISETDIRNIFEYYYTTKDKGIGLGLPISYMIVKDHGGDIKVFSEKGKGTKFVISLPLTQPKAENSKQKGV
jgi:signal transduction histidine kinase